MFLTLVLYVFFTLILISGICLDRYGTGTPSTGGQTVNIKSKSLANPRWRRVVFKISGAALAGTVPQNIDPKVSF